MGTGDYICVTLRGGAPWGFTLREGEGDIYRPFLVTQVEEGGRASSAGVQEGDEVVSLNGEPCADLSLLRALALMDTSIDCLQLLLKRYCSIPPEDYESEESYCGQRDSSGAALESTTLHIFSPKHSSQSPRELYISESQDQAFAKGPQLLCTQLHVPSPDDGRVGEPDEEVQRCFSPGDMVELQVSLSEQTLDDVGCTSLGSALGIEGELSNREAFKTVHAAVTPQHEPSSVREPLGQRGVVLSSPSMPGQVEVILQQQQPAAAASGAGRGILSVGGSRVDGSVGSQSEGEEGGGHCEGIPGSFTVTFGIPSEEATPADEQDSDSEGDQDKPNKHRARHARLRRSESLSEKQVKEAKSKCKRIALLLTAAPPNPNNKGVLMFKKHRQRAKKYTLVSYGTGEDEPDYSDEEGEDNEDDKDGETHTVEFTLVAPDGSEIDKNFLTHAHSSKGVLTINWDKGLLEIERNLNNQAEMECLPETKGKGALMFAQRRQRMDEISAEHDELRRQGIPVEGIQEVEKKIAEHSYMQSTTEGHTYMDVNIHQQSQQQQYQQYQEQQYYEQQQNYQQQQYQQHYQQQQYEQQHYQQQQMYQQQQQEYQQQQQEYHQQQQQTQHYSTNINGNVQHQTSEMQSSFSNRTAKPFSAENMVATPYSPAMSGTNQDSVGQGEQIASRDERISTPAIKTGLLMEARKRITGKPMFTFKEAPKVSPNPALLNLLNRSDRKGFESGPEEDYLSLGAEACNFLQSPVKHKTPPPVAPKPVINPSALPWSPQIEMTNQDMPQQAENSVSTPAIAPTTEPTAAPELEPTPAPAPEPSPPPAPQEVPASTITEEQPTWTAPEAESQQQPLPTQEEYGHMNSAPQPEPAPVTSWAPPQTQAQQQPPTNSWHPAPVQAQEPPPSQSPQLPPWVTRQPPQTQAQPQTQTNTWTPQNQPSWNQHQEQVQAQTNTQPPWAQPQEQVQAQTNTQPPWAQPQEQVQPQTSSQPPWAQPQEQPQSQQQVQPPWMHSHEQPNVPQMQQTWGQPQDQSMQQQPQAPWAQPSQTHSQPQPPWMQQPQQKPQAQPPWVHQAQPESQQPWIQQPQHQAPQQAWPQAQAPGQPQPPWVSAQPQQQQQPPVNTWPPSQTQAQVQPPWIQAPQAPQAQPPPQPQANLNPWAPVPAQAQSQPSWAQHPSDHSQNPMNSWAQEQNQAQHQPPWAQPIPPQPSPQSNWQQSGSSTSPQPQMSTWSSAQTHPQSPANAWAPQSQQTPVNVSTSMVNTRPSPKPWLPPQNVPQSRTPPPPPQRMHSFTLQRDSSPVNPMATVLNPASQGSAFEMPPVRGKGADMFAKRMSRMEKFVVDSETVEANKASRSTSPVASLPTEWKYTPNVRAPPPRAYNPIQSPLYPPAATKQPPNSPSSKSKKKEKEKQKPAPKPLNVIDVMKHQPYQLNSSLFTFGPATEAAKPPAPKPESSPPNPPVENQQVRYEQMAPVQPAGPYNAPYPQQPYGMPMQPMMHDGHYQQNPVYPPPNLYQQPPAGPYQQAYNQQYQQPPPPPYHTQAPQSPNAPYQQAPQPPYQPANSPPYLATPSGPYQPQPPSSYVVPTFSVAARPESASGGNPVAAPKPKFTAKKSSAQVWKPSAVDKE